MDEIVQELIERAQEIINWGIALLAGSGVSLTAAIAFVVKYYGSKATLKIKQLSLSQKNEEIKQLKEERDEYKKQCKQKDDRIIEFENCTRRAVTAFGTGFTVFVNGSRASEECKESANKYFREGFAALPEISTEEEEKVFEMSQAFAEAAASKRSKAISTAADSIGKLVEGDKNN